MQIQLYSGRQSYHRSSIFRPLFTTYLLRVKKIKSVIRVSDLDMLWFPNNSVDLGERRNTVTKRDERKEGGRHTQKHTTLPSVPIFC